MRPERQDVLIESSRLLLEDFFQVEEVTLRHRLADGSWSEIMRRLNLERGDSVAALLLNRDRRTCVFARQFRFPASKRGDGWLIELPAGVVEPGETPEETLRRELLEEVGYQAAELRPIATFFPSPGGCSERVFLYVAWVGDADRVAPGGGAEHEGESIEILEVPLADLYANGWLDRIRDGKTLLALTWLEPRLERGELFEEDDRG